MIGRFSEVHGIHFHTKSNIIVRFKIALLACQIIDKLKYHQYR